MSFFIFGEDFVKRDERTRQIGGRAVAFQERSALKKHNAPGTFYAQARQPITLSFAVRMKAVRSAILTKSGNKTTYGTVTSPINGVAKRG